MEEPLLLQTFVLNLFCICIVLVHWQLEMQYYLCYFGRHVQLCIFSNVSRRTYEGNILNIASILHNKKIVRCNHLVQMRGKYGFLKIFFFRLYFKFVELGISNENIRMSIIPIWYFSSLHNFNEPEMWKDCSVLVKQPQEEDDTALYWKRVSRLKKPCQLRGLFRQRRLNRPHLWRWVFFFYLIVVFT